MFDVLILGNLGEILNKVEYFPLDPDKEIALFVKEGSYPYHSETLAAIVGGEPHDTLEDVSDVIQQRHLRYSLELQLVQSIVIVAKENIPNATVEDIVDSFNFFLENDAFLIP